jgi:DNA-binding Lrp family transcriptional regulator
MISCCIQKGECEKVATDPSLCYAYVFIETEKAKLNSVKKALENIDQVVFCSHTDGGCDLVAVIKGENFSEVDRVIAGKIRVLDGILRLKHNRIIDLKQL